MARKRTYQEINQIDEVEEPMANTKIHGAITSLSPIKKGRNSVFFDGTLADGTSKISFDGTQQRKLQDYHDKKVPVELVNCEVKTSGYGEGYDVVECKLDQTLTQKNPCAIVDVRSPNNQQHNT